MFLIQSDDSRMQLPPADRRLQGDPDIWAVPKRFSVNPKKMGSPVIFYYYYFKFFFLLLILHLQ